MLGHLEDVAVEKFNYIRAEQKAYLDGRRVGRKGKGKAVGEDDGNEDDGDGDGDDPVEEDHVTDADITSKSGKSLYHLILSAHLHLVLG